MENDNTQDAEYTGVTDVSGGTGDTRYPVFPHGVVNALLAAPETPAFEHAGRTLSRADVLDLIVSGVHGLRAAGIRRGVTLALRSGVTPEGFALQIAAHLLGCRVIALRPDLAPGQLAHVLADGVDAVLTDAHEPDPELVKAAGDVPLLVPGTGPLQRPAVPVSYRETSDALIPLGRPDDVALVMLTSGSTGTPKGVERTYRSYTDEWAWQSPSRWTPQVRALANRYQRFLLFGTLNSVVMWKHTGFCLLGGGTVVIPEQPVAFPDVIESHRPTAMLLTVPRLHGLLDELRTRAPDSVDTSSLRSVQISGSPLTPHRLAEAVDRLGPVVYQDYGQTEAGLLAVLTPDDIAERGAAVLDSVGRAWAGARIQVRDEAGAEVPTGTTGEIWAHTPATLERYFDDPQESQEVRDGDGWVRTRDLGHLDADGFLRLTGRSRDVVIVNAVLHYTGPVERVLATHPDIDTAYVVGAPDEETGEAGHAFVMTASGGIPDLDELRTLVVDALGESSVPATITLIPEVPLTPTGKPDKQALLAQYGPHTALLPDPAADQSPTDDAPAAEDGPPRAQSQG